MPFRKNRRSHETGFHKKYKASHLQNKYTCNVFVRIQYVNLPNVVAIFSLFQNKEDFQLCTLQRVPFIHHFSCHCLPKGEMGCLMILEKDTSITMLHKSLSRFFSCFAF